MVDLIESLWNLSLQLLKPLHLHYHIAYDPQTWQSGDVPQGAPTNKITLPFDHVDLWDHVTNKKHLYYQSACGHRAWQDGKLPRRAPATHKGTWLFGHLALQDHKLKSLYLSYHNVHSN